MLENSSLQDNILNITSDFSQKIRRSMQLATDAEKFVAELREAVQNPNTNEGPEKVDSIGEPLEVLLRLIFRMIDDEGTLSLAEVLTSTQVTGETIDHPDFVQYLATAKEVHKAFDKLAAHYREILESTRQDSKKDGEEDARKEITSELDMNLQTILNAPDAELRAKVTRLREGLRDSTDPVILEVAVLCAK